MNPTATVDLPFVESTDTLGSAIERLRLSGKSGVVVDMGKLRYVVLEDQALRNSLVGSSDNPDVPIGKVAEVAFMAPDRHFLSFSPSRPVTALAQEQRNYSVTRLKDGFATVLTNPDRASRLTQPSALFGEAPLA